MKIHQKPQSRENTSSPHASSPNTTSTSSTSSSSHNSNGAFRTVAAPSPPTPPPLTPRSIPRSDGNPCPTTFIQADTSSFKQVVQMLTGSAETAAKHAAAGQAPPKSPIPPAGKATGPKKPAFKLYERRGSFKHIKMINPLHPTLFNSPKPGSPAAFYARKQPEILSPSMLDLPSLVLSPVTPLIRDPFNRCSPHPSSASSSMSEEDRAIADKGFYFHPSPQTTPREAEPPRLLPLFPVTSPRISSASTP